ncbi:hypothetical protein ASE74_20570 [Pedobacter sp. Leaf216]|uniref:carboxypeptidase-like regulatory domain-containing protein n=1 Tax=Pedobacter sp. Leaf216 TaxID=1735684 RepID=UPI0006F3F2AB|nr:carboxypeptidase-like regulatory domain-containing protein [Pedobacter sp. Leaf216]KQM75991.1 hypothetical protein ASE74_20570 [Pedobacter sp. Leaf216]
MPYRSKIILPFLFCCLFFLHAAWAQKIIKGHVINHVNKGIASVSIYNKGKLIALSDEEGQFSIKVDSLNKGQSLSFSSVGYESRSVKVDDSQTDDLTIKLKDKYVTLNDVQIYSSNFVTTLVKNAMAHLADTGVVSKKILCRQYLVKDGKYNTFAEGVLNLHTDEYKNDIKLQLEGIRRLKDLRKSKTVKINYAVDLRMELKSYFVTNLNDNMLSEDNDYEIEGQVDYEGTKCYKIYFNRARNVLYKRKSGWIYITVDKHLIKGMESNIATINKSMIWINKQDYTIENGLSHLNATYLKCNVVAGLFSEGEPSAEMELLFLDDIEPEQKNSNNFSTFKLRQDFYQYPKKNNAELWASLYQKHNLSIPKVIVETYKSDQDILEQF